MFLFVGGTLRLNSSKEVLMVFLLLVNLSTWTARYVPWGCQNICTSAHPRRALFSPALLRPRANTSRLLERPPLI